jgi:predicted RNase H-like HicB family nuclease
VIEKRGRWYVAFVEEIPGVNTQGRTPVEACLNLRNVLPLILETNQRWRGSGGRGFSPDKTG